MTTPAALMLDHRSRFDTAIKGKATALLGPVASTQLLMLSESKAETRNALFRLVELDDRLNDAFLIRKFPLLTFRAAILLLAV